MTTEELLSALGAYLASVGLSQYSADGDYRDDASLPAVLFAGADTPDHCLVATVTGFDRALSQWDLAMAFRATGINTLGVETLADAVADHFAQAFDRYTQGTWSAGTLVVAPTVTLGGGIVLRNVTQTARGTAELTSEAKHKGSRFVRTDSYRLVVVRL